MTVCKSHVGRLVEALQDAALVEQLSTVLGPSEFECLALLAQQACTRSIDYRTLGVSWRHPSSRMDYRRARHASFEASRQRQANSRANLVAVGKRLAAQTAQAEGTSRLELVNAFLEEIGAQGTTEWSPCFHAVTLALHNELTMPLRALNEGKKFSTFNGESLPADRISRAIADLTRAVVEGRFRKWRYTNTVGEEQLRGLTQSQRSTWETTTSSATTSTASTGIAVHEGKDDAAELDFFWATKIGGPSHGFDYESQCLLPLLCNARHKVILIDDSAWPHYPAGRAHFRLLWTLGGSPRLWLEPINTDFAASREAKTPMQTAVWRRVVVEHAAAKADAMGIGLSVDREYGRILEKVVGAERIRHCHTERLVLRPSNGVVEASDYLSHKHDWLQLGEEVTDGMSRTIYTPSGQTSPGVSQPMVFSESNVQAAEFTPTAPVAAFSAAGSLKFAGRSRSLADVLDGLGAIATTPPTPSQSSASPAKCAPLKPMSGEPLCDEMREVDNRTARKFEADYDYVDEDADASSDGEDLNPQPPLGAVASSTKELAADLLEDACRREGACEKVVVPSANDKAHECLVSAGQHVLSKELEKISSFGPRFQGRSSQEIEEIQSKWSLHSLAEVRTTSSAENQRAAFDFISQLRKRKQVGNGNVDLGVIPANGGADATNATPTKPVFRRRKLEDAGDGQASSVSKPSSVGTETGTRVMSEAMAGFGRKRNKPTFASSENGTASNNKGKKSLRICVDMQDDAELED